MPVTQRVQEKIKKSRFINSLFEAILHYSEKTSKEQLSWYTASMKWLRVCLVLVFLLAVSVTASQAKTPSLGIHILRPDEISQVKELFSADHWDSSQQIFVTIPYSLEDTERTKEWQTFFDTAAQQNIVPIVRLTTRFENDAWQVPTRKDVVTLLESLDSYRWSQPERHVIVFNEVNHAKEWGGTVAPRSYADILAFTLDWAHTQQHTYVVLPAALDLSAPQSTVSWDAYAYWQVVYREYPEVFDKLDGWNSHSYPNPAFSASPYRTGRTSLQGFKQELAWITQWTDKELPVYITETGWETNRSTSRVLSQYYSYALQHIWNDDRIAAVTPFLLKGDPGPFSGFSFLTGDNVPTIQYVAFQNAMRVVL